MAQRPRSPRPARKRAGAYHHGDLRRALLHEALRTIQTQGVGALTLRSVGEHLGVSHRWISEAYPQYPRYVELWRQLARHQGLEKKIFKAKKGQALIWAANLLHGGEVAVAPERTRKSQVTHCYFEDCSYYTPFRSDFARGKVFFRQITDINTGRLQPLRVSTGRVRPPLTSRLITWQRRLGRLVGRGYVRY